MSRREYVLLQVEEVQHQQKNGTLFMMKDCLEWIAKHNDGGRVTHRYADIKVQRVSPDNKPKIQWQIVGKDGKCSAFHFTSDDGALAERNQVKELLQNIMTELKTSSDRELDRKQRMFTERPHLVNLYRDLVVNKVLTVAEFWEIHASECTLDANKTTTTQKVGVSGAFMSHIKPISDGFSGIKYNLTPEIIDCVFRTFPPVKTLHDEMVGTARMSKGEFWKEFLLSKYFHRNRFTSKRMEIFSECLKTDDITFKTGIQKASFDPILDFEDSNDSVFEEDLCSTSSTDGTNENNENCNASLMKRFNQHSIMILQTSFKNTNIAVDQSTGSEEYEPVKQKMMKEKTFHGELAFPVKRNEYIIENNVIEEQNQNWLLLSNLTEIARCFHEDVQTSWYNDPEEQEFELEYLKMQLIDITSTWNSRTPVQKSLDPNVAASVINELTIGGYRMREIQKMHSKVKRSPLVFQQDFKHLNNSLSDLLKQFWACFPISSSELAVKATRYHKAILFFHRTKIERLQFRRRKDMILMQPYIQHWHKLVRAVRKKYDIWQKYRVRKLRGVPSQQYRY